MHRNLRVNVQISANPVRCDATAAHISTIANGTVAIATHHSDHANGRKYTSSAHGERAYTTGTAEATKYLHANVAGAGATRVCAAGKEIPY